MEYVQGNIRLSATDVANHLSCKHLTALNLLLAKGAIAAPDWANPDLKVLQQLGLEHEKAYVQHLRDKGFSVEDIAQGPNSQETTIVAMKNGIHVIVQATLDGGEWLGRADVLLRVEKPSALGTWSYEAVDCKLSRTTKAETILQLCFYSELLTGIQGREPERLHVVRPHVEYEPESFRVTQFSAYYRYVKGSLKQTVDNGKAATYPEVVPHCDVCRWWKHCDQQLRKDDSLSFVHGASRLQRKELAVQNIITLRALAELPLPIPFKPSKGGLGGLKRIREQARIQLEARISSQPKWEQLPLETGRGLYNLPAPTPGDIFFDFEGDPYTGDGGIEYLCGVLSAAEEGNPTYESKWALDRSSEKAVFGWFIDLVIERLSKYPDMHIFHFGSYEPSAVKRLVLRYATKELEVDRLLRGEVFVDLHKIFKAAILAGVEQYSLKDLEQFCGYRRKVPLADARTALHTVQHLLQLGATSSLSAPIAEIVAGYNEDDCRSTKQLRDWLETIRQNEINAGKAIDRPGKADGSPNENGVIHHKRVAELFDAFTRDIPLDPEDRNQEQKALWSLAHLLDWYRREDKVKWWEFFYLADMAEDDLYLERSAISGMSFASRLPKGPKERTPTDQYKYPPQECSIRSGDKLFTQDGEKFGDVVSIDPLAGSVTIKKPMKGTDLHPTCVFSHADFPTTDQAEAILKLGEWTLKNGIDQPGEYRAARDLLLRNPPRLKDGVTIEATDLSMQSICEIGLALDHSTLPIQGPPGSGKTFTAANMICALVQAGKRVGITAISHKVIRKLLDDVVKIANQNAMNGIRCGHRNKTSSSSGPVLEFANNDETLQALQAGTANVLGATSFVWSKAAFIGAVDVLVVDEAGQMALAGVLACSASTQSIILLGDPQQLEQPTRGSHPEGSDVSALGHVLEHSKTIDPKLGLFLAQTRRLHPDLCKFTSEVFYENRLVSHAGLERQRIDADEPFVGAGLWVIPVKHSGNQSHSDEEIEAIVSLVNSLTATGRMWTDGSGSQHPLSLDKILIVAPFNDQVNRLIQRLPAAQIGTVDRFQGQEGAVVIYSMTASSSEDAPRGMEFLYDLNRFNVATSRARCACIVVASPRLFEPDCRTPRQVELANSLCRYVELGKTV